ncbi:MAG: hypothetical protein M9924_22050 [Rhizobiaceae bacterium]|nr:hypothetical protein [Rhizobiaceae bacterium]
MTHKVALRENARRRSMLETKMRYDIMLNGVRFGELCYNMRGYIGYLPLPDGRKLDIGERPLAAFRREIARINREARGT